MDDTIDSKNKFIKSSVTVHDRTQIETIFDYYISKSQPKTRLWNKVLRYQVDAFFLFPRQFGINATTYPKEQFYADIRPLIRLREPRLSFDELVGEDEKSNAPMQNLRRLVDSLESGKNVPPTLREALADIRLFACSFVSFYLRGVERRYKRWVKLQQRDDITGEQYAELITRLINRLLRHIDRVEQILVYYRQQLRRVELKMQLQCGEQQGDASDQSQVSQTNANDKFGTLNLLHICEEMLIVNEYCFYRLKDGLARIISLLHQIEDGLPPALRSNAAIIDLIGSARKKVVEFNLTQNEYAKAQQFILVNSRSDEAEKEKYVYRRGVLKRRIWSVLFLDMRAQSLFAFQRQLGAMVAAGLAAFWAVAAQIIFIQKIMVSENQAEIWGVSGLIFVTAAILAYIVKDRIKEIGRGYFRYGFFRRIPDSSESIYFRASDGERVSIGTSKELTKFIAFENMPEDLKSLAIGSFMECEDIEEPPEVLHYTKQITLTKKLREIGRYTYRAVHDIMRYNIDVCLPRLAEPRQSGHIVNEYGEMEEIDFPKNYYMHMVLRYVKLNVFGRPERVASEVLRLTINKTGLLNIERLDEKETEDEIF